MAKTKLVKLAHTKGGIFTSSGFLGVARKGSTFAWRWEGGGISEGKGGYDTAEEAAYAYDEFVISRIGTETAVTNESLGLLKAKTILAIRDKLTRQERPERKASTRNKTGFKGVTQNKNKYAKKFSANCYVNGKVVYIGSYETPQDAARAYDDFTIKHNGADAETNEMLGLIPPRETSTSSNSSTLSLPRKPALDLSSAFDDDDTQPASLLNGTTGGTGYLSPEEERQKQIEAARTMAAMSDDEEEEEEEAAPVQPQANETAPPVKPATTPAAAPETKAPASAPAIPSGLSGELILAPNSTAAELRRKAEELLIAAAEAENKQLKNEMLNILDGVSHALEGYQKELMSLIDHGAEIEQSVSRLRTMLEVHA